MTFHDIFQIGACQNLKDSSLYDRFLFKCTRHEAFDIFNTFPLSATPLCLVRYFFFKEKDDFFDKIFQVGACPNLKYSSFYESLSIHMYKA